MTSKTYNSDHQTDTEKVRIATISWLDVERFCCIV